MFAVLVGGLLPATPASIVQAADPQQREISASGDSTTEATVASVPNGFQDLTVIDNLQTPTAVSFAPDGRVFVAEKSGIVKVYDSLDDTSATTFADLRTNVYDFWDRGLLGLAVAPDFPADPSVYVLYTYDHILGSAPAPPRWQFPGFAPSCPPPPAPPPMAAWSARGCRGSPWAQAARRRARPS